VLGWGAWGRHRVLAQAWDGNFRDASVTDGTWIITIGIVGWVGYLSLFGLLTYPVWRAFRLRNRGFPIASTALVGVLILNLIDLIPNSSLGPLTWLAAGALTGLVVAPEWRKAGKPARVAPSFNRMTPATT
jgi:hypothetical protein